MPAPTRLPYRESLSCPLHAYPQPPPPAAQSGRCNPPASPREASPPPTKFDFSCFPPMAVQHITRHLILSRCRGSSRRVWIPLGKSVHSLGCYHKILPPMLPTAMP